MTSEVVSPDTQPTYRVDHIGNRVYRFTLYCPTATWSINPDTPSYAVGLDRHELRHSGSVQREAEAQSSTTTQICITI